jgi:hypothetical protein
MARNARRAAGFFVNRALAASFSKWLHVVEDSREDDRAMVIAQRALGKLLNRALAGAFSRWGFTS